MDIAVLEAQARAFGKDHRAKREVTRQEKALELVEELDNNPQGSINYDWYLDYDPDLKKDIYTYIIVSRHPILEVQYGSRSQKPEAEDFFDYFKYTVLADAPIHTIKTPRKTFHPMGCV
jgi:hypothetical protein